jgi:His-Xaa-Ser system protein HxsD
MMPKSTPKLFQSDPKTGRASLLLKKGLYPMDAIYGASYVFIDSAYVLLDKDDDGNVLVHLQYKEGADQNLDDLAGTFANEALAQVLRGRLMREHKSRLEAILTQALSGGLGIGGVDSLGLDMLDDADDDLDFLDDPLGIAVPWEEKFKKSASEERPDTRDDGADQPQANAPDSGGFQPVKPEGPSE